MVAEGYKETEVGVIPVEWEVVKLNDIALITMGQSPKSDTYNTDKIGMPLIQGNADCKNRKTKPRSYTTELTKECFVGDIIMTVRAPVGAISKSLHNACIGRGVCSIKPNEDNEYIYHCLVDYENNWDKLSQGSTFTAVSGSDIKNLKFSLPPLKEQEKIADILSTADEKIDAIASQIQKAETLKKGLLQKLLSEGIGHSEFKDSELGKIPESWEVVKLSQVVSINPNSLTNSTNPDFEIEYIDIASIVETGTISETNLYKFSDAPSRARRIVNKNDILLSTVRPYLKSFSIVKEDKDNLICSTGYAVLRVKGQTYYEYIYQFVLAGVFMGQVDTMLVGSNYPAINSNDVKNIKLPFPPLEEQKQIANILSTADEKLEVLRAKKEKYTTLKKGLLQKLLSGEVRV